MNDLQAKVDAAVELSRTIDCLVRFLHHVGDARYPEYDLLLGKEAHDNMLAFKYPKRNIGIFGDRIDQ